MKRVMLVIVAIMVCGCAHKIVNNGILVYEKYWNRAVSELKFQASTDLECDDDRIEFVLIKRVDRVPTQVGVSGVVVERCTCRTFVVVHRGNW